MDREDIRLGIRNIKNLPTLPVIVSRILEVADDSGSSANELAELVARDMSVSAKVLNLAISAFYGFSRRITTRPRAVVVLGCDTVRSLALSVSVFAALKNDTNEVSFDREAFWIHSIGCGTASRLIAKELKYRDTGTFFVAGLLLVCCMIWVKSFSIRILVRNMLKLLQRWLKRNARHSMLRRIFWISTMPRLGLGWRFGGNSPRFW